MKKNKYNTFIEIIHQYNCVIHNKINMGVERTAFFSKELSPSGIVVGEIFSRPKPIKLKPDTKISDRRTLQPLGKNISNQITSEKSNPLTFGFLDF